MESARGDVGVAHAVLYGSGHEVEGVRHEDGAEDSAGLEESGGVRGVGL